MKTISIIHTENDTLAFLSPLMASIAKDVLTCQKKEFKSLEAEIQHTIDLEINLIDWNFSGNLAYNPNEDCYIEFSGTVGYDGEDCEITLIAFNDCHGETVNLQESESQVKTLIENKIQSDYNPDMYALWLDERHDAYQEQGFDEVSGN
jgi:hypothetical protein